MRRVPLAGLIVVLFAAQATATEPTMYRAVVTDPQVTLRAGDSDKYPDTGTLPRGATVIVEKDMGNGWLAVTAPPGSVSWVATQFIEDPTPDRLTPKNVYVETEGEITIATGKVGLAQSLDIRRVKLPHGAQLCVIGAKATFSEKTWYPIIPPYGDVRYLPKTAVKYDQPANTNFTVRVNENVTPVPPGASPSVAPTATPAGGPLATIPGPSITPATGNGVTAAKPAVDHPLWVQAEAAERENRLADAERLYFQLAEEMSRTGGDRDITNLCYTRLHTLLEKKRTASGTGTTRTTPIASSTSTNLLRPPVKEDRGVRAGAPEPLPPAAPVGGANEERQTGTLTRSNLTPDGPSRPLYRLESAQGDVKVYVTAGQGASLERYLGKRVEVTGTTSTRNGLSKPYMSLTGIELAP